MSVEAGYQDSQIETRKAEIKIVSEAFGFASVQELRYPPAGLDQIPRSELVASLGAAIDDVRPDTIYMPYARDAHTDHRVTFEATSAALKWFRRPYARRILAYETPSETGFALDDETGFRPNSFTDIGDHLDRKIEIFKCYQSENGQFPFPRSEKAIRALAHWRGSECGADAAEAFMLLKEVS